MNFENMIGFGVAGNFTGHLEQAGESNDFVNLKIDDENAPKGIFPFYIPANQNSFLSIYPLSSEKISIPADNESIQAEPEVALVCDVVYDAKNSVVALNPKYFGAYNDCSIRKPNAKKISEKKNWGSSTKGISSTLLQIDTISKGGILDGYKIASFLKRDGELYAYGIDSEVSSYSYFNETLISWIVSKMNTQIDEGPLENIADLLQKCDYPTKVVISIGATRYTEYGEQTYLQENDRVFVVLYPKAKYDFKDIELMCKNESFTDSEILALVQDVVKANR
jgi:hypothetical protein